MDRRQERVAKIINNLRIYRGTTIRDLAAEMGVSEMTIRRDVQQLSRREIVRVFHGGVILNADYENAGPDSKYSLVTEETVRTAEKKRIGQKAASLINPHDNIIIDSGSTTEFLAKSIPQGSQIAILCYSLNNLVEICYKNLERVVFAGGDFHDNTMTFESPEGVELIRLYRAHKAFFAARGFSDKLGVTTANHYEISMKQAALKSSLSKILLVDSTKFGKVGSAWYAQLTDFDTLITDDGIPPDYRRFIGDLGITLYIV